MTPEDERLQRVANSILKRLVPGRKEKLRVLQGVESVTETLRREFAGIDRDVKVETQGSVAKGTWLSGEADVDVFIIFPDTYDKTKIGPLTISVTRRTFGEDNCVERYAAHPYLTVLLDQGLTADVVPCFRSSEGRWISATDRTPYHTKFVKEHFDERSCNETRLLKRFLKGIEAYGAEIKVGGFSGYLAELLVFHFGSFLDVLWSFSDLSLPCLIDYSNSYTREEAASLFGDRLIVIDPTDKTRNVASAVRDEVLWNFVRSAREFTVSPSKRFFFPREVTDPDRKELTDIIRSNRICPVVSLMRVWDSRPDILWGQIYKVERQLAAKLQAEGFEVIRSKAWSDERKYAIIALLLSSSDIPSGELKRGPDAFRRESQNFIKKYEGSTVALYGPFIKGGTFYVVRKRKFLNVSQVAADIKKDPRFIQGIPSKAKNAFRQQKLFVGTSCAGLVRIGSCGTFLKRFLIGRPPWML